MAGKCGMPAISGQAFCVSLGEQCVHGVPALGGKAKQRRHPVSRVSNVPFDEAAEVIVREEHDANVLLHDEAGCARALEKSSLKLKPRAAKKARDCARSRTGRFTNIMRPCSSPTWARPMDPSAASKTNRADLAHIEPL